jgi:hypothetical protein
MNMHRSKSVPLASFGLALLGSPSSTWAQAQDFDTLHQWLTVQSVSKAWRECPSSLATQTPQAPYFGYNNAHLNPTTPHGRCREIGSFHWTNAQPHGWWVQAISNLRPNSCTTGTSCIKDFIRVCSTDLVGNNAVVAGPCASLQGVGSKGCEVCAAAFQSPL